MKAEVAAEHGEETIARETATSKVRADDGGVVTPKIIVAVRTGDESNDNGGVESDDSKEFIAEKDCWTHCILQNTYVHSW